MIDNNSIRTLICPKQKWVNDNDASFCLGCQKEFRPIIRGKHHCRFCGKIFCSNCSKYFIYGDTINYKEERKLRHCEPCHIKINQFSLQEQKDYNRKTHLFDSNEKMIVIEVDETQTSSSILEQPDFIIQQTQSNEQMFMETLNRLSLSLCETNQLECSIWAKRLAELAWKTVEETKIDTFIKKEYLNILKEIRLIMIKTPKDAVTAVCVKGLILERNIPSKQLDTHIKFPRILTVKPAIQADGLIKSSEVKFDEMIKNQNIILKNYLQKIFKIHPNVIFVEEHVSKVAFEYFLSNKIMVISKVKEHDMEIIEKLSTIKRRIDNLLFVDRFRVDDLLGVCDRIYFKTIKQGEMLMFIEHESGIRSVLLGDYTDEINSNLKKVFQTLLKIAWNMKKERQIIYRDLKIKYTFSHTQQSVFYDVPIIEKYVDLDSFAMSQQVVSVRAQYKHCRTIQLSKSYYQYCCKHNRTYFLDRCDEIKSQKTKLYLGEDAFLGSYLLQSVINSQNRCQKCGHYHAQRFFIEEYCVTVLIENYIERKGAYYNQRAQQAEQQEQEIHQEKQNLAQYNKIIKYFKNFQQKLFFKLFFKCEDCGMIIGNLKTKIGQQYLTITLMHFMIELVNSFKRKQVLPRTTLFLKDECSHRNIVRIIECPYILIKFEVSRVEKYQLLPIIFSQAMVKLTLIKDEKMIRDLYKQQIAQKYCCLQNLDVQLKMMPFYVSASSSSFISFTGMSAKANVYSAHFQKMIDILQKLKDNLSDIQREVPKYFEECSHDWTIVMRKIYKVEHVLKLMIQATNYLNNVLKKEKIEQNLTSFQEISMPIQMASLQDKQSKVRKYSEQKGPPQFLFKSQSIAATLNLQNSIRKDTSLEIESQIDSFQKKLRKQRFLRYRGVYMYFPIGNIYDPVSILACCLNSQEFNIYLNEDKVRDEISIKVPFYKTLKTEWSISQEMERIYRQLYRQDYDKNENYQFQFSIYYHKEFEQLRQDEGINFKLFVRSLYGCQNWDSSGGKSNSTFSKSHNQILVVKIINEKEFIQFQKFAPAYLKYMKTKRERNQSSYLAKIYGIYEANIRNKIYKFVVMQNIFFGMNGPMKVYDLKGSEVNRLAMPNGEKSFTGLDTNFVIDKDGKPYLLESTVYDKTIRILEQDANFLKQQAVIDYSLLVIESELTLRMGIIDFMRPYHLIEKIETLYKEIKSGKDPTVIPPQQYSQRFVHAMKKYFAKPPS